MKQYELEFAALLSYPPRPPEGNDAALKARNFVVDRLKNDRAGPETGRPTTELLAKRLAERLNETPFADWFGSETVLVPSPRRAPLREGALWVPQRLAAALVGAGLGSTVLCLLRRIKPVPKAAFSRSAAEGRIHQVHYDSIAVELTLESLRDVVLIDDVVTSGATLYGAARRLQGAHSGVPIRGFAAARAVSEADQFERLFAPTKGRITPRDNGTTWRQDDI